MKISLLNITAVVNFLLIAIITGSYSQEPDNTWIKDITHDAGLTEAKGSRIQLVDVNGDDYPDLMWGGDVGIIKNHVRLFLNIENPDKDSPNKRIFVDYTEESGITESRVPENDDRIADVSAMADLDNDGDMDLLTSIYYHRLQMYGNDPGDRTEVFLNDGTGHFTMVENNGLHDFSFVDSLPGGLINATGIAFLDYDYDGILDVYFSTWFVDYAANLAGLGEYKMRDFLFKGNGDGSFSHVPDAGIQHVAQPMYGVNVTDWNNDGWQDIATSPYCRSRGSLYRNNKDGSFTDASVSVNYNAQDMQGDHGQNLCQWEANTGDFDNDGDMDFLQVSVHGGYDNAEGRTHITVNEGAANNYHLHWDIDRIRRDAPNSSHLGDQGGQFFDINGDGLLDVTIGQMAYPQANIYGQERLYICMQNDSGYFDDISRKIGVFDMKEAHSMEPGDFDLDGDQDLFFSHNFRDTIEGGAYDGTDSIISYMRISLLRNDIGNKKTWSSVKLTAGENTNQSALGARIKVYSRNKTQMQEIQAGLGHFAGQQPFIRNFGLGDDNYIDSIVVRWPNANLNTSIIENPPTNLIIEIEESGGWKYKKTWDGEKPVIAFDFPAIEYDTVNVNSPADTVVKLTNIGETLLSISALSFEGNDGGYFELTESFDYPITVKKDSSLHIKVRFTPDIRRNYHGLLAVSSDAANGEKKYFDIFGFGFEPKPVMAVSNDFLIMDTVWVDSVSEKTFTIENTGEIPLTVSEIYFENDDGGVFEILNTFPLEIAEKSSEEITVRFIPKEITEYQAVLKVKSDGYNTEEHTMDIYGVCNGPFAQIACKTLLLFGTVNLDQSKDLPLLIENKGNTDLIISEISIDGDGSNYYSFKDLPIPFTLGTGKEHEAHVSFTPGDDKLYSYSATLVSNSKEDSELTIILRGTGKKGSSVPGSYSQAETLSLRAAPNPASGMMRVIINLNASSSKEIQLILTDVCGCTTETVINKTIHPGETVIPVNTSVLASGRYFLIVHAKDITKQLPVVIVR